MRSVRARIPPLLKRAADEADVPAICEFLIGLVGSTEEKCRMIQAVVAQLLDRDPGPASDVLYKLDNLGNLPTKALKYILEDPSQNLIVMNTCATFLTGRWKMLDEEALPIIYDCLNSRMPSAMVEHMADPRTEEGRELMQIVLQERHEIVSHLLQHPSRPVRNRTLELLSEIAKSNSNLVSSEILETAVHFEDDPQNWKMILKIAKIINPVHPLQKTVFFDTAFLMNWACDNNCLGDKKDTPACPTLRDELRALVNSIDIPSDLRDLMESSPKIDLLMFLPHKRYRSHHIHQFNVAVLGLFFLETYVQDGQTLREYIRRKYTWSDNDVRKAWLIASLLHDHALPISYMLRAAPVFHRLRDRETPADYRKSVDRLRLALEFTYLNLFSKDLRNIYRSFRRGHDDPAILKDEDSEVFQKIGIQPAIEYDPLDHGVLAAVNIMSRLKGTKIDDILSNAIKAIAVHSLKGTINLEDDPISFLLALCDELQEWGREIALFPEILIETSCTNISFGLEGEKLLFEEECHVSFKFITSNFESTSFSKERFLEDKKKFASRLKCSDANVCFRRIFIDPC